MKIVLIRHFKVGFKWKMFYNSSEYEVDCGGYNTSTVIKTPLSITSGDRLITSTMSRALETSKFIFNRDPDLSEKNLCEVPIKPFVETKLRLPKVLWDIVGRLQWRFNLKKQPESYKQSKERVSKFIDSIVDLKQNVVIVCHGWIIKLIIQKLKSIGFRGPNPIYIKNGVPYEFTRKDV
jgi:broad specificity phosphatase PhoE